jgi:hypothetical protein
VTFPAGNKNIIKQINVEYEYDSDLVEIKFDEIRSSVTKKNLIILGKLYNIKWEKITRYPVNGRFGYIIEGILSEKHPVTYIRKELNHQGSGQTDLWFGNGHMIPAPKLIRIHEKFNTNVEYWGQNIKKETIDEWAKITSNTEILMSYKLSNFVYGNKNKGQQVWKHSDEIIEWIVSIARKIHSEDFLKLLNELQKVQFERFV